MADVRISEIRFIPASEKFESTGLLGWASFVLGDLVGMAVGVRRTRDGKIALSFPSRRDGNGILHQSVWPHDDEARVDIESRVIATLRERGVLP